MDAVASIIRAVGAGAPVRRAIREAGISCQAFYDAIEADASLRERYARAKARGIDALVDEMLEIADDRSLEPEHKRYQIDVRKFYAAKLAPKVYGDRLDLNHGAAEGFSLTIARPAKPEGGE